MNAHLSPRQAAPVVAVYTVLSVAVVAAAPVPMPLWLYAFALLLCPGCTWALFRRDARRAARRVELERDAARRGDTASTH